MALRWVGGGVVVVAGAGAAKTVNDIGAENVKRSMSYNKVAIPGFIAYKYCDWRTSQDRTKYQDFLGVKKFTPEERNAAFAELDKKWSQVAIDKIHELKAATPSGDLPV